MIKIIKSKALGGAIAMAAMLLATTASQAAVVGNLNVNGSPVQGGNAFSITGGCATGGTVSYSLVNSNGVSTSLGSATTTPGTTGTFNSNVSIPSNYATGPTTLVATCPNGDTVTSSISVLAPSTQLLTLNTSAPNLTGNTGVSGACANNTGTGTVSFMISQEGSATTSLPNYASASGNSTFNGTVSLPTTFRPGLATITASCPNGQTLSTLAVLGNPNSANVGSGNTTTGSTGTNTYGNNSGQVAGVATTPVGGVAAGNGGTADSGAVTLFFLLTGVVAAAVLMAGKQMSEDVR